MVETGKMSGGHASTALVGGEDWLDRGAFFASALCLVHCLALPLALAALPALSASVHIPESFHRLMLLFIVPTSGCALWLAWTRRRVVAAGVCGAIGILLLAIGSTLGGGLETIVTVCGSILLASAHVINWKSRRATCR